MPLNIPGMLFKSSAELFNEETVTGIPFPLEDGESTPTDLTGLTGSISDINDTTIATSGTLIGVSGNVIGLDTLAPSIDAISGTVNIIDSTTVSTSGTSAGLGADITAISGTTIGISGDTTTLIELVPISVMKTDTQQVVNSTVLVDDTMLKTKVLANQLYDFKLVLNLNPGGATDPGFKMTMSGPTLSSGAFWPTIFNTNVLSEMPYERYVSYDVPMSLGEASPNWGTNEGASNTFFHFEVNGYIDVGATPGSLQFRWAQFENDLDEVRVGSYSFLELRRRT